MENKAYNGTNSYTTVTEVFDWGPAITKVIVDIGRDIPENSVNPGTFKVKVVRTETRIDTPLAEPIEGERNITKAYISDADGNSVSSGRYVTLEMEVGPELAIGSPINYDPKTYLNAWLESKYTITQTEDIIAGEDKISGLVINECAGDKKELVDDFTISQFTYGKMQLKYASYSPATGVGKRPLIIWLHGSGEGGSDGILPIAANKASNFASEEIQSYFDGAYILVPQCPTQWMGGLFWLLRKTSKYKKALFNLIKDYIESHKDIDTNRIYIGGASSGGYMAMVMTRDYWDFFAAAFPTCEVMLDKHIKDSQIQKMKNIPIWFTAAKTDVGVPFDLFVGSTYDRLLKAGAKNVHLSLFDKVLDTTGLYKNKDGSPYEYYGHFSWIHVYNNKCELKINGKDTTIMEWLSCQCLDKRE